MHESANCSYQLQPRTLCRRARGGLSVTTVEVEKNAAENISNDTQENQEVLNEEETKWREQKKIITKEKT